MWCRALCVFAVMIAVPQSAIAQPGGKTDATAAIDGINAAGHCLVRRDRALAIRVLEALPVAGEPQLQSAARIVRDSGCMVSLLPENFALFLRGAIVPELLKTDFPELGAPPHNADRLVDLRLPVESDDGLPNEDQRLYRWSDCVARNDTVNVERLIQAPSGSQVERNLMLRMAPYFSACMDSGARLSASAPDIRSLLTQSTYHMLYRFWTGQLTGAGLVTAENRDGRLICRTYLRTGTLLQKDRVCMTPRDWERARLTLRDELHDFIARSTSRP